MAVITKHLSKKGIATYQVKVRRQGISKTVTFPTKKQAEDYGRNLEQQIVQSTYFPTVEKPAHHTVDELIEMYCQRVLPQLEPSTQKVYLRQLAWWQKTLSGTNVKSVTPELLEKHKYDLLLDKHYAPSRVNLYLASLSVVFTYGASRPVQWLEYNPLFHVKRFKDKPREPKITDHQRQILLTECSHTQSRYLHLYIHLVLGTGGRAKEVMNLRWHQVDLKTRAIEFLKTKNKENRQVPLGIYTCQLLKDHQEAMFRQFLQTQSQAPLSDFGKLPVFHSYVKPGRPITSLWNTWDRARKKAGLPTLHIHDCRHIFADTTAEKGGADLADLQKLLGHKNIRSTLRYRHVDLKDLRAKVDLMEEKTSPIKFKLAERAFQRKFDFERKE